VNAMHIFSPPKDVSIEGDAQDVQLKAFIDSLINGHIMGRMRMPSTAEPNATTVSQASATIRSYVAQGASLDRLLALHRTVANSLNWIIPVLLSAGANPNHTDENGCTPLHVAACVDNSKGIAALIDAGADKTITCDSGSTPYETLLGHQQSMADFSNVFGLGSIRPLDANGEMLLCRSLLKP